MNFKDKVAVITGAGTGTGAATAQLLASKGCKVVINFNSSQKEAERVKSICTGFGVDAITCQGDISKNEDCLRIASAAAGKFKKIDFLVNNAAVTKVVPYHEMDNLNSDDFLGIFAVNVIGAYQMARAVKPYMIKAGGGGIVNVSSSSALDGRGSSMAYASSKGALNSLTLALATSLGEHNIRVNAVCPSLVNDTPWWSSRLSPARLEQVRQNFVELSPLHTISSAADIAQAIVSVLELTTTTGEFLRVDSGIHLGHRSSARPTPSE